MATENTGENKAKSSAAKSRSIIIVIAVLLLAAAAAYFLLKPPEEVTPDYSKYLEYINTGDSLVKVSKFPEAKKSYDKALKYNPRDSAATKKANILDSADKLIKKKDFAQAKKMFDVVINIPASQSLSQYALDKAGAANNPPLKITLRWKGNVLEITITGGLPFGNENQPYVIEGLDCKDCVTWKKDSSNSSNYIADVTGTKIKTNKIKAKDKLGQFSYGSVPKRDILPQEEVVSKTNTNPTKQQVPVSTSKSFEGYVKSGDSLFSLAKYPDAKNEYVNALSTRPADNKTKQKIAACDEKIKSQQLADAKNIPRSAISSGTFNMGTNDGNIEDGPQHSVSLRPFSLSQTEVTVGQYKKFCAATGRAMPPAPAYGWVDDYPIVNVTWDEARAYCEWVGGRLPTEAEWEYAAGGGASNTYSGSNQVDRVAFYKDNSGGKPKSVGQKAGNAFRLKDMTGNVSEWCADWFGRSQYGQSEGGNPKGPSTGSERVVRGGAFNSVTNSTQDGNQLRITYRNSEIPSARKPYIGFRVAWSN